MSQSNLWTRWKAVAHRAAEVQSNVLLWLLYYLIVVPIALLQRPFARTHEAGLPAWRSRPHEDVDPIVRARRQF